MEKESPQASEEFTELNLRDYLSIIWRRKWIVIVLVVLVTGSVTAASLWLITPKYQASTELLQLHTDLDKALLGSDIFNQNNASQPDRDLQTAAQLVVSPELTNKVNDSMADQLGGQDVAPFVSVDAVSKTDILRITATHPNPQTAADIANQFALQYIDWRRNMDQQVLTAARQRIESQIAATPASQQDSASYRDLQDKLQTFKVVEVLQTSNLEIVNPATPPPTPSSPNPVRNVLIALFSSLIGAIGIVFLIHHLDTRIRNTDDINSVIDKPILASIPRNSPNSDSSLATLTHPAGAVSEAYRLLKTNLAYVEPDKEIKSIMVTSIQPGDGKSTTIANLAVTLARAGKRVIVIEADFRRPSMTKYFGLQGSLGVTNAISGGRKLQEILQVIEAEDLVITANERGNENGLATMPGQLNGVKPIYCATSGPIPPNPGELASSDKLGNLITEAMNYADIVLVDAPPLGIVGDAASMASKVDGIIYVVQLARTSKKSLKAMKNFIVSVPSNALGVVATNSKLSGSRYSGYMGDYQYYRSSYS